MPSAVLPARPSITAQARIWIPTKVDAPTFKIEIVENEGEPDEVITDITDDLMSWMLTRYLNNQIDTIDIQLPNPSGKYTGMWSGGEVIKVYFGYDTYTQKWEGYLMRQPRKMGLGGRFISITGWGYAVEANDIMVTKSYSNQLVTEIFKDLITTYLPSFTADNVIHLSKRYSVEWQDIPLLACLEELRSFLSDATNQYDFYCEWDKDWHLFERYNVANNNEGVVFGYNMLDLDVAVGIDKVKNRIKLYGEPEGSLPLIHTVEDTTSQDATWVREDVQKITSITDIDNLKEMANILLAQQKTQEDDGSVGCIGMDTLIPGQNIYLLSPLDGVDDTYRVKSFTHNYSADNGFTTSITVDEPEQINFIISKQLRKDKEDLKAIKNINGMDYSFVMRFDDLTELAIVTNVEINDNGELILSTGSSTGTATSINFEQTEIMTEFVMMVDGQDLDSSTIEVSLNAGTTWTTAVKDTLYTKSGVDTGQDVQVRITLVSDSENTNPKIAGLAVLMRE